MKIDLIEKKMRRAFGLVYYEPHEKSVDLEQMELQIQRLIWEMKRTLGLFPQIKMKIAK